MRSLLLSSVLLTVLLPARAAFTDEPDDATEVPPTPSACVQALERCGASVRISGDGRVLGVGMPPAATDAHLASLRGLPDIEQLYVACPKVTDRGLACVKHLGKLRTLSLNQTQVTDGGLANLKNLRLLRSLYLDGTAIGDDGMVHLSGVEMLRVLSLRNTRITDEGLRHLQAMKHIRVVHLTGTGVTADGAFHLRRTLPGVDVAADLGDSAFARKRLKELGAKLEIHEDVVISVNMETQRAVDEGLQLLSRLCSLKRLSLDGVTLNVEHITSLARLTDLQSLDLVVHKKIPHEDYKRLCRAMPGASIGGRYVRPPLEKPVGGGVTTVSLRLSSLLESEPRLQIPEEISDTDFRCSYYRGIRGKESIPVVVLHDWGGSIRDFEPLARRLQKDGCAVIVPELWPGIDCSRPPGRPRDDRSRDRKWMERDVFLNLGCAQLEVVGQFLQEEHDRGVLNLGLACILAEGHSGFLAANSADWPLAFESPDVNTQTQRLLDTGGVFGETDVDPVDTDGAHGPALVLLSPHILRAYSDHYLLQRTSVAAAWPTMIVVGAKSGKLIAAMKVHASLKRSYGRYRAFLQRGRSTTNLPEAPNLSFVEMASSKQGAALCNEHIPLLRQIADFIDKSAGQRRHANPWIVGATSEWAFEEK